jgi:hypothetical protein
VKSINYYYKEEADKNGKRVRVKEKIDLNFSECGDKYFKYEN